MAVAVQQQKDQEPARTTTATAAGQQRQ
uniref:Uncharacterized protein n=1 Tax=Arundo donax TaxID=35708 RepID=A0A0A9BP05_ARUDO